MLDLLYLPRSLKLMGFKSSFAVNFWATRITVPVEYISALRQGIDAAARAFPQLRVSGYFFDDPAGQVNYQMNRVPGPPHETLTDQDLNIQLAMLLEYLNREGTPYETQFFSVPPQNERFCLLFGLGKGFSGIHFQRSRSGMYCNGKSPGKGSIKKF